MNYKEIKASFLLITAAIIWGFAFVAQRVGIQYVGSYTFNGVRFALGAFSLLPLILIEDRKLKKDHSKNLDVDKMSIVKAGGLIGIVLFIAATLQQVGLEDTTAGKAAFITGFYIILVPFIGVFLNQKTSKSTWISAIIAIIGLYLVSMNEDAGISKGDLLVFISAFFWSIHIILISRFTQTKNVLKLSFTQYIVCSIISLIVALIKENIQLQGLIDAIVPLLYGGVASVGIAYTLQAYGQKHARASHAAIIMSLESVFALIGGYLILNEVMSLRGYLGCALMFVSVLLSQIGSFTFQNEDKGIDHSI